MPPVTLVYDVHYVGAFDTLLAQSGASMLPEWYRKWGEVRMKERVIEAGREVMRACIDAGGTLTGEHGIEVEKQMYMHWAFTEQDMAATKRLRSKLPRL